MWCLAYRDLHGIFMSYQTNFRGPCVSGDNCCDEDIALIVCGIRSSYMGAIGRPAMEGRMINGQNVVRRV